MRLCHIICLGAAIAVPQFASAQLPFDTDTLAELDGALDFCAQMEPKSADAYRNFAKVLEEGLPKKDLEEARNSKEYKDARQSVSDEIGKLKKEDAAKACSDFLKADQ